MSDEVKRFEVGQKWEGCWECVRTFAKCTHLLRGDPTAHTLRVTAVDPDTGTITISGT